MQTFTPPFTVNRHLVNRNNQTIEIIGYNIKSNHFKMLKTIKMDTELDDFCYLKGINETKNRLYLVNDASEMGKFYSFVRSLIIIDLNDWTFNKYDIFPGSNHHSIAL